MGITSRARGTGSRDQLRGELEGVGVVCGYRVNGDSLLNQAKIE